LNYMASTSSLTSVAPGFIVTLSSLYRQLSIAAEAETGVFR
jgi:hypothetical protein